ncbi:MAG: poly-gamma-glutamate synthase PgsB, partial [Mesotoga sp.]|nr:poly-gamma-glutamate synthase PgsB [Mesotoga sp.]
MTNLLLALVSLAILLFFLVIENILSRKRRKRLKIVIQVNGTRGKSETVRLIHSALKANGFSVLGKTTGTVPLWITPD